MTDERPETTDFERVLRALHDAGVEFILVGGLAAYPRDAPPNLPFQWDATTLQYGLNFTLSTDAGPIDLLGEVVGGGVYDALREAAVEVELFGIPCLCVGMRKLIELKRAAGRPRDFEVIAELEQLADQEGEG